MKYKTRAGLQLVTLMLGGVFFTWAHATFSVTDCSDTGTTGIPETECEVLEILWDSTNGPGWTRQSGWDTGTAINS